MEKTKEYTEIKEPISFVDELPKDRETAVIDLATLHRLADSLLSADIDDIVNGFTTILQYNAKSRDSFIKILDDESAFHKTVKAIVKSNNKK